MAKNIDSAPRLDAAENKDSVKQPELTLTSVVSPNELGVFKNLQGDIGNSLKDFGTPNLNLIDRTADGDTPAELKIEAPKPTLVSDSYSEKPSVTLNSDGTLKELSVGDRNNQYTYTVNQDGITRTHNNINEGSKEVAKFSLDGKPISRTIFERGSSTGKELPVDPDNLLRLEHIGSRKNIYLNDIREDGGIDFRASNGNMDWFKKYDKNGSRSILYDDDGSRLEVKERRKNEKGVTVYRRTDSDLGVEITKYDPETGKRREEEFFGDDRTTKSVYKENGDTISLTNKHDGSKELTAFDADTNTNYIAEQNDKLHRIKITRDGHVYEGIKDAKNHQVILSNPDGHWIVYNKNLTNGLETITTGTGGSADSRPTIVRKANAYAE